jgi:hypothetical protein
VIGALCLADAPHYARHASAGHDYSGTLAVAGALFTLPWLASRFRVISRQAFDLQLTEIPRLRGEAWQSWRWLMSCVCLFVLGILTRAPVHVIAPLALGSLGLMSRLIWRVFVLSLGLVSRDRPQSGLLWVLMAPCSLAAPVLAFVFAGDSWATLLAGCVCSCVGITPAADEPPSFLRRHAAAPSDTAEPRTQEMADLVGLGHAHEEHRPYIDPQSRRGGHPHADQLSRE